jgi:hypothetical protein
MTENIPADVMKTMFFPFTHISKNQLTSVTAFFQTMGLLPLVPDFTADPLREGLTEKGILKPLFSSAQALGKVEKQVQSYLDWARLHKGNERNLKSLLKKDPYFMDAAGLPSIQSQIRRGAAEAGSEQKEAVQNPLLLLKFSQLLDAQNEGIDDELMALESSKTSLFSELTGEISKKKSDTSVRDLENSIYADPGRIMTEARVLSWFRYAHEKKIFQQPEAPLLVTTSPAVLDFMASQCEGVINALDIDCIKVHENGCEKKSIWQQIFLQFLKETMTGKNSSGSTLPEADDTCNVSGRIKLCLFPEGGMKAFLNIPDQSIAVCLVHVKS